MNRGFLFRVYVLSFILFVTLLTKYWGEMMVEQDFSSPKGGSLFHYSAFLISLISVLWIFRRFSCIKLRGIHKVCFLWILIMPVIMFLNHANKSDYVMTILWPLFFEMGYIMMAIEDIKLKQVRKLFFFAFFIGLFYFIQSKYHVAKVDQTNTIYFPFLTAPFLLCCRNKRLQMTIFIIFSLIGVLSFKRSVFLIVVCMWLFYVWQIVRKKKNVLVIVGIVGLILIGGVFALKRIDQASGGILTARAEKSQDDEGGGRLTIYTVVIGMIDASTTTEKITGHGHMGVKRDSPLELAAHNDVLEVIYDYGLIILLLYIALWFYVIKRLVYFIKNDSIYSLPFSCSFAIFFLMSMVSHLILYTSYFNYLVLFWGCMEGLKDRNNMLVLKNMHL